MPYDRFKFFLQCRKMLLQDSGRMPVQVPDLNRPDIRRNAVSESRKYF